MFETLLRFAQAGLAGIAVVVLYFTWDLLRREQQKQPPNTSTLNVIRFYIKVCLSIVILAAVAQVTQEVMAVYQEHRLSVCSNELDAERRGKGARITAQYLTDPGEWHWQWGAGHWESDAKFYGAPNDVNAVSFYVDTYFRSAKDSARIPIMRWESSTPATLPGEGLELVEFRGTRKVFAVDDPDLAKQIGPPTLYRTVFEFRKGKSLLGKYRGLEEDGKPTGGAGNIVLYLPPR